jgi:predicted RNA-binding protein with PIN domain
MPPQKNLLIDGYNVINRVPELRLSLDGGLENARLKLALRVSAWSRDHPATECIIIFDGDYQYAGGRDQRIAGIRCIFSKTSHGGDDEIIRLVRELRAKNSEVAVVSDDNKVCNNCHAHSASVQPSKYIMAEKKPHSGALARNPKDGKGIDRKARTEIDNELRKKFGLE